MTLRYLTLHTLYRPYFILINFKICDIVTNTLLSVKAISHFCLHSALIRINALIINE